MHGNTVDVAGKGALSMVTVTCRAFDGAIVRFKRETLKQRLQVAIQNKSTVTKPRKVKDCGTGRASARALTTKLWSR